MWNDIFIIMERGPLVKAFELLEALADRESPASLAELCASLDLPKPTAHRVLQSLLKLGYVHHAAGGNYSLTPKLSWLTKGLGDRHLAAVAHPLLLQLRAATNEEINLGVLRRNRISYLTVLACAHPLRRVNNGQESDPVFSTALGRIIVAHLPPPRQREFLANVPIEPRTPRTVTSTDELQKILAQARSDGYAVERDQTDLGVTCIAAPVLVHNDPIAAISISFPSARISAATERQWIPIVCETANAVALAILQQERASA
jgi:DNA-binding IclR family transcriptional regulator